MIRRSVTGSNTFEDFCNLVREDQKADLIDGVIYMASPESSEHNDLLGWLGAVLRIYVTEKHLGRLTLNKVAFRLSDHTAPEPDLAFVSTKRSHLIKSGYVDGPPDLAIEIVSPESIQRDYELKRQRYDEAGVLEYWIIDPLDQTVTTFVREGDAFVEQHIIDNVFESRTIPGMLLDVRWLFQRPRPTELSIIPQLLG